jgi:hypothetical protein
MPEGLLVAADGALDKAKHNGRNCVDTALLLTPDESSVPGSAAASPTAGLLSGPAH